MIILIAGDTHTGKTLLAQRLPTALTIEELCKPNKYKFRPVQISRLQTHLAEVIEYSYFKIEYHFQLNHSEK